MKKTYLASIVMIMMLSSSLIAYESDPVIECTVVSEDIEKIVCKVQLERADHDRVVTFFWHSKRYPQDDRDRSVVLNANHGSVYDYRFLRGRVQGEWSVSVIIVNTETQRSAEVDFVLEGSALQ